MSIIGEAMLTATVELLFKKLASEVLGLFARKEKIHDDLMKWKRMLVKIKAVLDDAEDKQIKEVSVKMWLDELRNLAYDVDDILDEFETEALRRKLLVESPDPSSSSIIQSLNLICERGKDLIKFDSMMMSKKVKEITARFQDIVMEKDQLGLHSVGKPEKFGQRLVPTTSLVNEAIVYGREKEKEEIVEWLLRDDLANAGFSVLPILGLGGLGKTTLAQLVYNDVRVRDHFDLKAWTCVSQDFDLTRVTKSILSSIAKEIIDGDLNYLQEKLKEQVSGKKFFLVLDDIWNDNYNHWTILSCPFGSGAPGSKIIVTTRNQSVAAMTGTVQFYPLKELSNEDCLRVFTRHSLGTIDFSMHQSLKEIGEKIVMKCNGLPLAAKSLGGLLRGSYEPSDWEDLLNCKIWDLPEERCDIMPALRVSYHYLSPLLKKCFAHCSLFPKNYEFQEEEIIFLWMAEGFLHTESSERQMEDLGSKIFQELHSRSFFQQSSNGKSHFLMHDLINDLAQWAAGETYFRMEDTIEGNKQQQISRNLRHLSYNLGDFDGDKRFEAFYEVSHLRTFLPVVFSDTKTFLPAVFSDTKTFLPVVFSDTKRGYLARSTLDMLLKQRRLRVLSLSGYLINEIPNSIGYLKHLRFLNLSNTKIKTLPELVNTLYNLHTLIVEGCYRLKKLCADMGNLIKLHHLNNSDVHLLEEMPLRIGKLTCLKTLCSFVVGKETGSGLQELKSLVHLQGSLTISRLENVKYAGDASEGQLNGKANLKALLLEWCCVSNERKSGIETRVLDMLKPHRNLKELTIEGYGGTKFPTWLGNSSLSNLELLRFHNCDMCTSLPSVGQLPSLKYLEISGMDRVQTVGPEFYGNGCSVPFRSLETLSFEDMLDWQDWIPHGSDEDVVSFPNLRELSLVNCCKLQGALPERLPSLERLVVKQCEELLVSIPSHSAPRELNIDGSKKVVCRNPINLSSLNSIIFADMLSEEILAALLEQGLPKLEKLEINNMGKLTYLWQNGSRLLQDISSINRFQITSCSQLLSLVAEEEHDQQQQGLLCRLQYFELSYCQGLLKLPQALFSIRSLCEMRITDCDSLVSFPEAALPSQLRTIAIENCNALESLPEAWMLDSNTSFKSLDISSCNSLTYIARVELPRSLKHLTVSFCENLRTLTGKQDIHSCSRRYTSLIEHLWIVFCSSLTSLFLENELPATLEVLHIGDCSELAFLSPSGNLPKTLKLLDVSECSKLESIAERLDSTSLEKISIHGCENLIGLPEGLHMLCHLQEISISSCPNLVSFPEGGLPSTKLTKLKIWDCEKLEASPNCIHNLTSLENLEIGGVPSTVSFPTDGFPTNLYSLEINGTNICEAILEWGLNRFSSLRRLKIDGECPNIMLSPLFPASLIELEIAGFRNLERLSSVDENLTSLEFLSLLHCPKLKYFPEKGLPTSLLKLHIWDCPLLEKRCKKDEGQYWSFITHIPCFEIKILWAFHKEVL